MIFLLETVKYLKDLHVHRNGNTSSFAAESVGGGGLCATYVTMFSKRKKQEQLLHSYVVQLAGEVLAFILWKMISTTVSLLKVHWYWLLLWLSILGSFLCSIYLYIVSTGLLLQSLLVEEASCATYVTMFSAPKKQEQLLHSYESSWQGRCWPTWKPSNRSMKSFNTCLNMQC